MAGDQYVEIMEIIFPALSSTITGSAASLNIEAGMVDSA